MRARAFQQIRAPVSTFRRRSEIIVAVVVVIVIVADVDIDIAVVIAIVTVTVIDGVSITDASTHSLDSMAYLR